MSKRFTETEKWRDKWFRKLHPYHKLVFIYYIENCNMGGFLEVDEDLIATEIGLTLNDILGANQGLIRGCLFVDGWVWVKNFLRHQKNENLNFENNAHKNIIARIKEQINRFSKNIEFIEFLGAYEGLFSPIGKGKVKVIIENKIKEGVNSENSIENRKQNFISDLEKFKSEYESDLLNSFFVHWSEKNKSGTKMKFELEPTWELNLRLKKWSSNELKFKKNGKENFGTDKPGNKAGRYDSGKQNYDVPI